GLYPEPGVGHAARHRGGNSGMREFLGLVTPNLGRADAQYGQEVIEVSAGSRSRLAVHETDVAVAKGDEGPDLRGVAGRNHEALASGDEADEDERTRPQERPVGVVRAVVGGVGRDVKAGHIAASLAEIGKAVEAAAEMEIDLRHAGGGKPIA